MQPTDDAPRHRRTKILQIRLRMAEREAFERACQAIGQTPSRVMRRLVREAVTGGPDYFDDGLQCLRALSGEVQRVGHNLNQLTRAYHRGLIPHGAAVQDLVRELSAQYDKMEDHLRSEILRIKKRQIPQAAFD